MIYLKVPSRIHSLYKLKTEKKKPFINILCVIINVYNVFIELHKKYASIDLVRNYKL